MRWIVFIVVGLALGADGLFAQTNVSPPPFKKRIHRVYQDVVVVQAVQADIAPPQEPEADQANSKAELLGFIQDEGRAAGPTLNNDLYQPAPIGRPDADKDNKDETGWGWLVDDIRKAKVEKEKEESRAGDEKNPNDPKYPDANRADEPKKSQQISAQRDSTDRSQGWQVNGSIDDMKGVDTAWSTDGRRKDSDRSLESSYSKPDEKQPLAPPSAKEAPSSSGRSPSILMEPSWGLSSKSSSGYGRLSSGSMSEGGILWNPQGSLLNPSPANSSEPSSFPQPSPEAAASSLGVSGARNAFNSEATTKPKALPW